MIDNKKHPMKRPSSTLSSYEQLFLQAQMINSLGQAIFAVDLKGHIIFWNQYAEKLYGWKIDEVSDRDITEILAIPTLMKQVRSNMILLKRGESWSGQFLAKCHDGTLFENNLSITLIHNKRNLICMVSNLSDNTEHYQLREANQLIAEVSSRLAETIDYETPLTTLAQLAVPQLADWCVIHLIQADGSIEQVAAAPPEMIKNQAPNNWLQNFLSRNETDGLPAVLRSGEPKLITDITSDNLALTAAIKSYMIVPLISTPRTLGAITFVAAESGRSFDRNTLALAENIVSHITLYFEKARLFRESQRLNTELEQRVNERTIELREAIAQMKKSEATIETLFRISNKLNATLDINTILDELAQEAIQIVHGESGFAGLRTSEGMSMWKYFYRGISIPFEHTWSFGEGIPGWVLKKKIPYGTSDAIHDPVLNHDLAINLAVQTIICTPIMNSADEVLAFFDIRNKQNGGGFSIDDQEMLMDLAPVASIAIQNAQAYQKHLIIETELKQSYQRLRELTANLESVREEERIQIARELHDQLGQALTAMKFDMAWLTNQLGKMDPTLAKKTRNITVQIDNMVKTVRRIATELRPGMLDDLGLAATIEWQAHDFEKRTGIICDVNILAEDLPLARVQSLALYRIFQEILTNVARHSQAQLIEIVFTATPEVLTLQVHDDGRGIRANEIAGMHSLGLLGMRERAIHQGGTFDIHGIPGDGTIVTVSIPVKQNN